MKHKVLFLLTLLCLTVAAAQAQIQVKGNVVSKSDQEPVIGASVVVMQGGRPSATGTVTDLDGNFTLSAPKGAQLRVSYIGYKDVLIAAAAELKIQLEDDSQMMDEVVVTGYATEKKADLTGSVSVVKMKDVSDTPTGNVMQALQGRVAGMSIVTDGTPGGTSTSTSIRGNSSFRSEASSPLYVIDGVMTRDNMATVINSADIESIQVLKDAASASIYGAQAANGVIIITTKRAKKGEAHVTFDVTLTAQAYHKGLSLMNADEWGEVYWDAYKYANNGATPNSAIYGNGATPKLQAYANLNGAMVQPRSTDWEDEIHRTALMQTYTVGLSKGADNGSTSLTLSWLDHKGVVKGTDFKRANARLSSDYFFLNNRLKAGGNLSFNWWQQHLIDGGLEEQAVKQHPAKAPYDETGVYNDAISDILGDAPNGLRLISRTSADKHEYHRVFGNAYLSVEPIKNLIIKTNFGVNLYGEANKVFEPMWLRDEVNKLTQDQSKAESWVWTNTAQYNLDLGKHSLMALAGIESKHDHSDFINGYGTRLSVEDPSYLYLSSTTTGQTTGSGASNYSMFSVFGKVNYSYASRYLASFTIRRDASSRLSSENNADIFPAFSAGWRISEEKFWEPLSNIISDFKLRGSWGINGNDLIDNEAFYTKYLVSLNNASYNMNGNGSTLAAGAFKTRSTNPDLKWERTYQTNIGFDAQLLRGALTLSFDYFYKKTKDMLVEKPYIAVIGEGGYCWYNGGEMVNKGIEATIDWRSHIGKVNYNVGLNMTVSKNKVTYLLDDIYYTYGGGNGIDKSLVGQPFGSWMGYETDGVFHTQQEVDEYNSKYQVEFGRPGVGRIRYVDTNNDGKINNADRTWLGCDLPKAQFGLNLGASWNGFDISAFFNSQIRDVYNNSKYYTDLFQCWNGNHGTSLIDAAKAWENFQTTGVYNCDTPAPTTDNANNEHEVSRFYIENGNYIRLKTLTLGYTLPEKLRKACGLANARIYFQAQNLFTITSYTGADPEGLGYPYALPKQFTFGLQFGF